MRQDTRSATLMVLAVTLSASFAGMASRLAEARAPPERAGTPTCRSSSPAAASAMRSPEASRTAPSSSPSAWRPLPASSCTAGRGSTAARVKDAAGGELASVADIMLKATSEGEDTRIEPGESRAERFTVPIPEGARAIVARLEYHDLSDPKAGPITLLVNEERRDLTLR